MAMNFNDFDLQTQEEDLARRKAIVDALLTREASGKVSMGDSFRALFGQPKPGQAQLESYARDNASFQKKQQEQLSGELDRYMTSRQGQPARPAAPDANGQSWGPDAPAIAANPREAVVRAMTSRLPEMQAIGRADFASLNKAPERKEHVIGNQLVESVNGQARVLGTYNKADWVEEPRNINGQPVLGQKNTQTGEWKPLSPSGTTVNVDTKGQSKVQEDALKVMASSRDQVIGAQTQLESAQRVLGLVDDPQVQTGFGAGVVNGIAAMGAKLGLNGPEGVAKTQALMTDLARNTLNAGQQMKGSFSDKDIQFLSDVTAGKVDYNPMTIKHIASLAYAAGHNSMLSAMQQYSGAKEIPGIQGADKVYPLPEVRWDGSIGERKGFTQGAGGRLRYDGDFSSAAPVGRVNSQGRKRFTLDEFLAQPVPGGQQ